MLVLEFTGERVVPGQVEADLWNEHIARYLFAARLARGKRVVDLGCGAGYGSAELARTATSVLGCDISKDAVEWARKQYELANLRFEQASCDAVPLEAESVDLAVAFEVIEHLHEPEKLLAEACRLLAHGGQFVVSTPNTEYYAESREAAGPNPYHHHEFSFQEFQEALSRHFSHVALYTQNHAPAIAFQPIADTAASSPVVRLENSNSSASVATAHFFIAVCAQSPQVGSPSFFYLPTAANVLRERELHITRLQEMLDNSVSEHSSLLDLYRQKEKELKAANEWAKGLDSELKEAVQILDSRQAELDDRTRWALDLDARLQKAAGSRWLRLGRKLGFGPDLR